MKKLLLALLLALCVSPSFAANRTAQINAAKAQNNPANWVTIFKDDSTKPMSLRVVPNFANTFNGGYSWGPFSSYAQINAAVGTYVTWEWTDGYATNDPHEAGSRRDDSTWAPNPLGSSIRNHGYAPVVRDTASGITRMYVRQKARTVLSGYSTPNESAYSDGSYLGAMLKTQYSLYGPPPFEAELDGVCESVLTPELWVAFWSFNQDDMQSTTDPTQRTSIPPNGGHTELDFWERTNCSGCGTPTTTKAWSNMIWANNRVTDGNQYGLGQYNDVGTTIGGSGVCFDIKVDNFVDRFDTYIRQSGTQGWKKYRSQAYPVDYPAQSPVTGTAPGRFQTTPVFIQLDAKAGYRWGDQSTGWVGVVSSSTPDFYWSWRKFTVRVPQASLRSWVNKTIDPATIPSASQTWNNAGAGAPSAIDNSKPSGTVLANGSSLPSGWTYKVYGDGDFAYSGTQLQIANYPASAGNYELTTYIVRPDGAMFQAAVQDVTVQSNVAWWDTSAVYSINYATQTAYAGSNTTSNIWSTLFDGSGNPTSTLQAYLPGFATAGEMTIRGSGATTSVAGLYGFYDSQMSQAGYFAVQIGDFSSCSYCGQPAGLNVAITDGANAQVFGLAGGSPAISDPFGTTVAWTGAGVEVCTNAGTMGSSANPFNTTGNSGPIFWNDRFGDRAFPNPNGVVLIYSAPGSLPTATALQAKCTAH